MSSGYRPLCFNIRISECTVELLLNLKFWWFRVQISAQALAVLKSFFNIGIAPERFTVDGMQFGIREASNVPFK